MESHVEQSLRDRILQYLKIAGLKYKTESEGPIYVGPLVVFIGPKGAEVHFSNQSQRHRLRSSPSPEIVVDHSNRRSWAEVVRVTKDPEEVITYIDNLLNPSGAKTGGTSMPSDIVLEGSTYVREDIAILSIREERALGEFLEHGVECSKCNAWYERVGEGWSAQEVSAGWDDTKLCKKGRILHDKWDDLCDALYKLQRGLV